MDGSGRYDRELDRLTEVILGAPVEYTREETARQAGTTVEQARSFWRAMGFPDVGDRQAFTAADVEALRRLVEWVESGWLDHERAVEMVRGFGQSASRLADWQAGTMARVLSDVDRPVELDTVVDGLAEMMPGLEVLLVHAWRRHLAAVIGRGLEVVDELPEREVAHGTVGFADIAGFTRLVRLLDDDELAAMVESFETGAADVVAARGARLVKTLGDEVMFVTDDADGAVRIASGMHGLGRDRRSSALHLRIGLATGRLVSVMGDYYGDTVNRASRLTAIAKPGETLMDPATEQALTKDSSYVVRHRRPRALRGLGLVRAASVLPRAEHVPSR